MIKKGLVAFLGMLFFSFSFGQSLTPSDADSKIAFKIKNMGINVDGSFKGLKGAMKFNPKNLAGSLFDVTVDAATINTENTKRDKHLKTEDFFDVAKYPTVGIKTTKILAKGRNTYFAKAVLTMHGVSRNIQFRFIAKPTANGYHFTGGFPLNRKDFGIGGNSMTMSDDVSVSLDVTAKK